MKDKKHTIAADSMSAFENKQKSRRGILRIWHASHYSIQGLRAGWNEPAFRLESVFSFVLVPLAFWLGQGWVEVALLSGSILILMIVELLNTAVESAIDRNDFPAISATLRAILSSVVQDDHVQQFGRIILSEKAGDEIGQSLRASIRGSDPGDCRFHTTPLSTMC